MRAACWPCSAKCYGRPLKNGKNRKQLLSYISNNGKMVYVPGLVADVA